MKENELFEIAERCVHGSCEGCGHKAADCDNVLKNLLELAKTYKAELEQLKISGAECAVMPDYEAEDRSNVLKNNLELAKQYYEEINRQLEEKLCVAEIDHERIQRDLFEAQKELAHLRAVKATAEAFLGRKIEVK